MLVKFHVTGNENFAPFLTAPWGREESETWKLLSPTVTSLIEVRSINAVQLTVTVAAEPSARFPKSTGEEQFSGKFTGDPRQYKIPFASVVYNLVSPKLGRWNLLTPPICGRLILFMLPPG